MWSDDVAQDVCMCAREQGRQMSCLNPGLSISKQNSDERIHLCQDNPGYRSTMCITSPSPELLR